MKIGFYKPGKITYFHNDEKDYASWSYEIVNIMKIFADQGHKCYILSDSDLALKKINNIYNGDICEEYDKFFFFSGDLNEHDYKFLKNIKSKEICLYFTDLRLWPQEKFIPYFNKIYSIQRDFPDRLYAGNNESYLYKMDVRPLVDKTIKFYYGGGERNRLDKIFEYIIRPNVTWTGRSPYFDIDTRLYNKKEYLDYMDKTKYSICILDKDYSDTNALTQRHYEHVIHNIISFIDNDFDRKGYIIPLYDWRRVSNYKELYEKMNCLEKSSNLYKFWLDKQKEVLKKEYYDGSYVYSLLK